MNITGISSDREYKNIEKEGINNPARSTDSRSHFHIFQSCTLANNGIDEPNYQFSLLTQLAEIIKMISQNGAVQILCSLPADFREPDIQNIVSNNFKSELDKLKSEKDPFESTVLHLNYSSMLVHSSEDQEILALIYGLLFRQAILPTPITDLEVKCITLGKTISMLKLTKDNVSLYLLVRKSPAKIVEEGIAALEKYTQSRPEFAELLHSLGIYDISIIEEKQTHIERLKFIISRPEIDTMFSYDRAVSRRKNVVGKSISLPPQDKTPATRSAEKMLLLISPLIVASAENYQIEQSRSPKIYIQIAIKLSEIMKHPFLIPQKQTGPLIIKRAITTNAQELLELFKECVGGSGKTSKVFKVNILKLAYSNVPNLEARERLDHIWIRKALAETTYWAVRIYCKRIKKLIAPNTVGHKIDFLILDNILKFSRDFIRRVKVIENDNAMIGMRYLPLLKEIKKFNKTLLKEIKNTSTPFTKMRLSLIALSTTQALQKIVPSDQMINLVSSYYDTGLFPSVDTKVERDLLSEIFSTSINIPRCLDEAIFLIRNFMNLTLKNKVDETEDFFLKFKKFFKQCSDSFVLNPNLTMRNSLLLIYQQVFSHFEKGSFNGDFFNRQLNVMKGEFLGDMMDVTLFIKSIVETSKLVNNTQFCDAINKLYEGSYTEIIDMLKKNNWGNFDCPSRLRIMHKKNPKNYLNIIKKVNILDMINRYERSSNEIFACLQNIVHLFRMPEFFKEELIFFQEFSQGFGKQLYSENPSTVKGLVTLNASRIALEESKDNHNKNELKEKMRAAKEKTARRR